MIFSDAQAGNKKSRGNKSIARRLTAYQVGEQISLLLFIDILLAVTLFAFLAIRLSGTALKISQSGVSPAALVTSDVLFDEYRFTQNVSEPMGYVTAYPISSLLAIPDGTVLRVTFEPSRAFSIFRQWLKMRVTFAFPVGDGFYHEVVFVNSTLLFLLLRVFWVALFLEIAITVRNAFRFSRRTRRLLRPLTELTRAAQNVVTRSGVTPKTPASAASVSAGAVYTASAVPEGGTAQNNPSQGASPRDASLKLTDTIDALNSITEQHLDRRIEINDERVELRGLVSAVNGMLDRLDAAYRTQLRFVSDASHELRTPISVIQGYANLLDRWGKKDETTLQESIDAIKNEAESMKELVEQLLFLARSDNQSLEFKIEELDVSQLCEEVARETHMIDEGQHEFSDHIEPDLFIQGDYQLIKQALRIFIDNSIKYTPPGGKITIRAARSKQDSKFADISITDNGIGISEKALPHVFDRFFRADESRTRSSGGTGLGLSLAKLIIERHDGIIDVVSRENIGTKFTMSFFCKPIDSMSESAE